MAAAGVASRRKSEEIIAAGRVKVNGRVVREMGVIVDLEADQVEVDGHTIRPQRTVVLAMNKPRGVVTTMRDERGRPQVTDFLPSLDVVVKPVGRLDKDTEGLLLFTNDGELAALLTHPKHSVSKTYRTVVEGMVGAQQVAKLERGIWLPHEPGSRAGRKTAPAKIESVGPEERANRTTVEITIREGRKRQVRQMFEAVGHRVLELKRIRFGPIALARLAPGACRMLSKSEIAKLKASAKIS
jgi:pseudouridine synthase